MASALCKLKSQKSYGLTFCQLKGLLTKASKKEASANWEAVIGLEIHAQIDSQSKLFSGASNRYGGRTNDHVAPLDASLPGTLPVLNSHCVKAGVLTALALGCHVNLVSHFDRKHYFYADLPTGYQITQQRCPLATGGRVDFLVHPHGSKAPPSEHSVRLTQLQLEQDSGKSLHDPGAGISLIDLNRAGVGLMEIVTEPDIRSAEEAAAFVRELRLILLKLGTCTCKMQEGSLRVDASVSVRQPGDPLGVRREVKNLNSMRFVAKAIDYEIGDQISLLESGQQIENETRSFDPGTGETVTLRDKEKVHDYRFMPEPNLPPLHIYTDDSLPARGTDGDQVINVDSLRRSLPELPTAHRNRLHTQHGLNMEDCLALVGEVGLPQLYEAVMERGSCDPTVVSMVLTTVLRSVLLDRNCSVQDSGVSPEAMADVCTMLQEKYINKETLLKLITMMVDGTCQCPRTTVLEQGWGQENDPRVIETLVDNIIAEHSKEVAKHGAKKRLFRILMAKLRAQTEGKVDSGLIADVLLEKLQQYGNKKTMD